LFVFTCVQNHLTASSFVLIIAFFCFVLFFACESFNIIFKNQMIFIFFSSIVLKNIFAEA